MGATETWFEAGIIYVTENDGPTFLRRGAERHYRCVRLEELSAHELDRAITALESGVTSLRQRKTAVASMEEALAKLKAGSPPRSR